MSVEIISLGKAMPGGQQARGERTWQREKAEEETETTDGGVLFFVLAAAIYCPAARFSLQEAETGLY